MRRRKPYRKNVYRSLALVFQFGINMLVPIGMMLYLGIVLDEYFHTQYIVVLFFFLGAMAGFTNIVKMAKAVYTNKDKEEEKEADNRERSRQIREILLKEMEKKDD